MQFKFQTNNVLRGKDTNARVTVEASDEDNARRLAMVKLYGEKPDLICPDAPNYFGRGLLLVRS